MRQAEATAGWDFDQSRLLDTVGVFDVPSGMTADHET